MYCSGHLVAVVHYSIFIAGKVFAICFLLWCPWMQIVYEPHGFRSSYQVLHGSRDVPLYQPWKWRWTAPLPWWFRRPLIQCFAHTLLCTFCSWALTESSPRNRWSPCSWNGRWGRNTQAAYHSDCAKSEVRRWKRPWLSFASLFKLRSWASCRSRACISWSIWLHWFCMSFLN